MTCEAPIPTRQELEKSSPDAIFTGELIAWPRFKTGHEKLGGSLGPSTWDDRRYAPDEYVSQISWEIIELGIARMSSESSSAQRWEPIKAITRPRQKISYILLTRRRPDHVLSMQPLIDADTMESVPHAFM